MESSFLDNDEVESASGVKEDGGGGGGDGTLTGGGEPEQEEANLGLYPILPEPEKKTGTAKSNQQIN